MAHGAFKVLDSDIHIIEPPDLWPRYIDAAFRERAPVGLTEDEGDLRLALDGKPWGRIAIDADRSRRRQGRNYALNQERWRPYAERGWTSKVQLESFLKLPISEESKRKILWDNCAAYYGLPSPTAVSSRGGGR